MTVAQQITECLRALNPERVEVVDESAAHAGHGGARPEGETHFRVLVVAERFAGLSPVARHRLVNEAVAALLAGPVHALALTTRTPAEIAASNARAVSPES